PLALWVTAVPSATLMSTEYKFNLTAIFSDTEQAAQLAPGQTYTMTLYYSDADRGPMIENSLAFYYWSGSQLVRDPTSVVDTVAKTLRATSNRLGLWAVLGETQRTFLPLVAR